VKKDVAFLSRHNLMDYSLLLLLLEHPNPNPNAHIYPTADYTYSFGVIDFLQKYTKRKQLETMAKTLVHKEKAISALDGKRYGERFLAKLRDILVINDSV
jgi:hypothetical protein